MKLSMLTEATVSPDLKRLLTVTNFKGKFDELKNLKKVKLPETFDGTFMLNKMDELTSLEGSPHRITGDFMVVYCPKVTSLKGGPTIVDGHYNFTGGGLKSLVGAPHIVGKDLTLRLEYGGSIESERAVNVLGNVHLSLGRTITSLRGIDKLVDMSEHAGRFNGVLFIDGFAGYRLGLLSLLKVKGLKNAHCTSEPLKGALKIVEKYLALERSAANLVACQDELIDAEFDWAAEL